MHEDRYKIWSVGAIRWIAQDFCPKSSFQDDPAGRPYDPVLHQAFIDLACLPSPLEKGLGVRSDQFERPSRHSIDRVGGAGKRDEDQRGGRQKDADAQRQTQRQQ